MRQSVERILERAMFGSRWLMAPFYIGLVLALVCRWLVAATARKRARAADRRLRTAISEVSAEMVVAPIEAELASYSAVREGLTSALR